jgi:hypothetical protein
MAGKAFAYSLDCQSRITTNYFFKVSLSESGIIMMVLDQLGWIETIIISFWGGSITR